MLNRKNIKTLNELTSTKSEKKIKKSETSYLGSAATVYKNLSSKDIEKINNFNESFSIPSPPNTALPSDSYSLNLIKVPLQDDFLFEENELFDFPYQVSIDLSSDQDPLSVLYGYNLQNNVYAYTDEIHQFDGLFSDEMSSITPQQPSIQPTPNIEKQLPVNKQSLSGFIVPNPQLEQTGKISDSVFNAMTKEQQTAYVKFRVKQKILALEKEEAANKKMNTNVFFKPLPVTRPKQNNLNNVDNKYKPS